MGYFDLRSVAGRFRFFAVLEALSWLGLLIGMGFKYLPEPGNEVGVKIFGPVHGAIFMLFVLTALLAARELNWNWKTTVLALLSSIPPFFTVVFEVWAVRTGKLTAAETADSADAAGAVRASS
ncbi:DUF3817 domain-containing protein [Nocardia farcinica]|uniref:DUF3817 domain-containing protein n=1 Tax=Nocardia farcinica TaxID=37329 RepID=UPI001893BA81|nr:DUF3817 domain-containing protein [Nocardia farcinica]MBF6231308.1 DUF3817 domain-containing protein [Nocardia farcinica]MBF6252469.1 DUF3817 domain-containing protein [Nocardia farcinica]MBF6258194.1 DUF3817 domain-containing protein [Nocardia farcinica]MBF6295162.1 DUF3817 domain-containing protein [Nocardia farcinica]MBF6381578.1 DUF3817 domain-containing protein [Nocardia farcinica]